MSRRTGFTLIELLLAIAIFAILAVGFYTAFSTGLLAHLRGEKDSATFRNARLVLTKIAADFQNALYTSDLGLGGSASEIYFFILPEAENSKKEISPNRVTYSVQKKGGTFSLLRDETPFSSKMEKEASKKAHELGGGLKSASFGYFREVPEETEESLLSIAGSREKSYEWVKRWKSTEGFPLGIRVTLEYPDKKFERLIPSPLRFYEAEETAEKHGEVSKPPEVKR